MTMTKTVLVGLCLGLILCGCRSAGPFPAPTLSATHPLAMSELLGGSWALDSSTIRMRHTVLLELGWRKLPMVGLLELDRTARTIRLVAVNDLGIKLFDLTVTVDGYQTNYLFPELATYAGLGETVAASVRKIFLDPLPRDDDRLTITADQYQTRRSLGDAELTFTFGGERPDLLGKELRGGAQGWVVRYHDYRDLPAGRLPGGVVLEDHTAGYRLTLWLEKANLIDG
ncbi:MAG: DUF3261 domain-containing protein [Desulfuromonadales bacterium]|nr:DUF3261 domain-containing protein [Desulfuromonadales bacterium]